MKTIASFTVDHIRLLPGLYVSRKDSVGLEIITTFDLRITAPNRENVMDTGTMHTIEHIGATFLRNDPVWAEKDIYFGPMGCRTGFYLVLAGDYKSSDILPLIIKTFECIRDFEGDIPGATPEQCGNYSDQNLEGAKAYAKKYLEVLYNASDENLNYPL